jgi:hypothetical protein
MPDDPTKKGGPDRDRVNIHEEHEMRYWTERLGVSRDKLQDAVKKVGPMVDDIEAELGVKP